MPNIIPLTLTYSLADQDFSQTKSMGIFNVSTQFLKYLINSNSFGRLTVLTNSSLDGKLRLSPEVLVLRHNEAISGKLRRMLWDQWGVYKAAKNSVNQWLFLPKGFASFLRKPVFKLAVYIHDAIHDFYRNNYPGFIPWPENKYFMRCLKNSIKHSDVIFTNSDFTQNELRRLAAGFKLNLPQVITAGIGFKRIEEKAPEKSNSLLFLSSAWPHKLTRQGISFLERWQRESGFSGRVELIGSLPRGMRLPCLSGWSHHQRLSGIRYRQFLTQARALLFFSAYEGFGMPPVEAMIAGTCPVFSELPVTREVMGGRGFSFSNDSYEAFACSMDQALKVSQTQIQLWSEELLRLHSWDKVVEKTVKGLKDVSNA
jgi:glycosyltransferase involved in cell wall biosynthesis